MKHGHYASASQRPGTLIFKTLALIFSAIALHATNVSANSDISTHIDRQSIADANHFNDWRKKLAKGDHEAWRTSVKKLEGRPLFPYLQYLQLNAELSDLTREALADLATHERVHAFLEVWPSLPISDNLKRQWLRRLGKDAAWPTLLKQNLNQPPTDIRCLQLQALYETETNKRTNVLEEAKTLWRVGHSQPKRCDGLFDILYQSESLTADDYQQRIITSLRKGNLSLARWLNKKLPAGQQSIVAPWLAIHTEPERLQALLRSQPNTDKRALAEHGMHRLANQNPELAVKLWDDFLNFTQPSPEKQHALWRRLALKAARSHHPFALEWLYTAELKPQDSNAWGWFMRAALAQEDWESLRNLSQMPLEIKPDTQAAIDFWGAYAASQLGNPATAKAEWQQLAQGHHWYSYLAADQLRQRYAPADAMPHSTPLHRNLLNSYPALRRAQDLHRAGVQWLARGEWQALLKALPNKALKQEAAILAHELGWPSMAARTQATYSTQKPDDILFPRPWQPFVTEAAKQHGVAPAHIWSQMRSESLFMTDVRSGAGAMGLMQLMPATAKSVGRSLKLKNWRRLPLLDPATNIQLGTHYLAEMLNRFQQQLPLAAAAYNAGPRRVDRWLAERPYTDPIRWIELIPFQETRRYVQRSLFFHSRYDKQLHGKPSRITDLITPSKQQLAQLSESP